MEEYDGHHMILSVREMAHTLGISDNGIRFLEDKGVVTPARDDKNGYRRFVLEDQSILYMYKLQPRRRDTRPAA